MARPISRLFHAVVVVGASLSACDRAVPAASTTSGSAATPEPDATPEATPLPAPAPVVGDTQPRAADAEADADAAIAAITDSPPPTDPPDPATMRPQRAADPRGERCPPGSEAPFPPCFHIL